MLGSMPLLMMSRWMVAIVALVLGIRVSAADEPTLHLEASAPVRYAYRNAFGQTEHYIVVSYRLRNVGSRAVRNQEQPLGVAIRGLSLNDGFRPLVQAAFCRERGCPAGVRSTPELQGAQIHPGRAAEGLAIFPLSDAAPKTLTLRPTTGSEVLFRRASGNEYAPVTQSVARQPSKPPETSEPAELRERAQEARRGSDESGNERRSWSMVHSSVRSPDVAAR